MMQTHGEDPQDSDRLAGRRTHGDVDNFEQTPFPTGAALLEPGDAVHSDWLRLDRVGNEFIGYVRDDGEDWIETGRHDWGDDAPAEVLLGLAVCSHSLGGCVTATIQFDSVKISAGFEEGGLVKPGDVNFDGAVNISDPVAALNHLFGGQALPECYATVDDAGVVTLTAAGLVVLDWNGDNSHNIADPVASLGSQFGGGAGHALGDGCVKPESTCTDVCQ